MKKLLVFAKASRQPAQAGMAMCAILNNNDANPSPGWDRCACRN